MKHGPEHHLWQGDAISYRTAHDRVLGARGRAKDHECRRCGGPAQQWAYDFLDLAEIVSPIGEIYSTDPDHYIPLCRSCHARFDRRNLCRRGHRLTDENSYVRPGNGKRWCRICEAQRKARARAS